MVVQSGVPLGGVGKTQVAVEYVHRFAAQYDLVAWINAEDPQLVPAQLTALAAELGLVGEHGEAGALPALRTHLQQPKRWLLVFDNAETADPVQPWVPAGVSHVLITSRSRTWSEFARVNLELLSRRESLTLLRNRVPELTAEEANLVADKLGDLPLALVQAATVLSTMPAELYLQVLDTDADEVLNEGLPPSYPRSLAAALRVSINELADHGEALELLRLCCVLAPEPIPMPMLGAAPDAVPESLRPVVANPMRLYRTATQLGDLVRVSQRGFRCTAWCRRSFSVSWMPPGVMICAARRAGCWLPATPASRPRRRRGQPGPRSCRICWPSSWARPTTTNSAMRPATRCSTCSTAATPTPVSASPASSTTDGGRSWGRTVDTPSRQPPNSHTPSTTKDATGKLSN